MIIGITGGIGSGKSTIARALEARGYAVYDCDKEAKRIIAENKEVQRQIIALFGEESFVNGNYNTQHISQCVFSSPQGRSSEALKALNRIVHPAVREDIKNFSIAHSIVFVESAILYEAGLDAICDKIVVVGAPEEVRIARTIVRDYDGDASPANINKVRARIHAQKEGGYPSSADRTLLTIHNDGKASIDEIVGKIIHWM